MKIIDVFDPSFKAYGKVIDNVDFSSYIEKLGEVAIPEDGVAYEPSVASLEAADCYEAAQTVFGGELKLEFGYCAGHNTKLNAVEYHRSSEINVCATDAILMLGLQKDVEKDFTYDTSKVKAFFVPAGTAVEVYATSLHYAPCNAKSGQGFKVLVVLPMGTNTDKPDFTCKNHEDTLMTARNKWLLAHPESNEAKSGAVIGLKGINIDIAELI